MEYIHPCNVATLAVSSFDICHRYFIQLACILAILRVASWLLTTLHSGIVAFQWYASVEFWQYFSWKPIPLSPWQVCGYLHVAYSHLWWWILASLVWCLAVFASISFALCRFAVGRFCILQGCNLAGIPRSPWQVCRRFACSIFAFVVVDSGIFSLVLGSVSSGSFCTL